MINERPFSRRYLGKLMACTPLAMMGTSTIAGAQERTEQLLPQNTLDYLEIEHLIYRYGAAIDNLDSAAMQSCFAANGALVIDPKTTLTGDFAAKLFENAHSKFACTMHNVQNHLYTIQQNTAQGWTYCIASHVDKRRSKYEKMDIYIRYDDQLAKNSEGRWQFIERRLHTLFTTTVPVERVSPHEGRSRGIV
jgi:hypothetical protein